MKKIGIVGGLGPESTLYYYRLFIDLCHEDSGFKLPEIIIYSLEPGIMGQASTPGKNKSETIQAILSAIKALHRAGADFALVACNTAHRHFPDLKSGSPIPLISIVEETCKVVRNQGLKKVGLIGSLTTMTSNFYPDFFLKQGVSVVVPDKSEQIYIKDKLLNEIVMGIMLDDTRNQLIKITRRMVAEQSIEGLILGCTELPLLINKSHEQQLGIPVFDTSKIHVQSALKYYLSES